MSRASHPPRVSRFSQWFGLLGGAVAWLLHFFLVYGLSEVFCNTDFPGFDLFGASGEAALLLGATLFLGLAALAVTFFSYRNWRRLETSTHETAGRARFMTSFGVLLSGFFTFLILLESLPVFFFDLCG